jgi:hypothetical protein
MTFRLSCAMLLLCIVAPAQTTEEYRVKAAFLHNFPKFVEWPSHAFKNSTDPIVICILGKNPFGDVLDEAVSGKTADGRPFSVRQVADVAQARLCHILFISASERKRQRSILDALVGTGTLTVGENDTFAEEGGVMNLKIEGGSVRLQINVKAAAQQQLHISSKLLSLAEIVKKDL